MYKVFCILRLCVLFFALFAVLFGVVFCMHINCTVHLFSRCHSLALSLSHTKSKISERADSCGIAANPHMLLRSAAKKDSEQSIRCGGTPPCDC